MRVCLCVCATRRDRSRIHLPGVVLYLAAHVATEPALLRLRAMHLKIIYNAIVFPRPLALPHTPPKQRKTACTVKWFMI